MAINNHNLEYPTLIGGIEVRRATEPTVGTLGLIVIDLDDNAPCILSAAHVLALDGGRAKQGDLIFQPRSGEPGATAFATLRRWNSRLDVATAAILSRSYSSAILAIGPLGAVQAAAEGQQVIKSGAATGVTQGVVVKVSATVVHIQQDVAPLGGYTLSEQGDSGACWVTVDGRNPVALHRGSEGRPPDQTAVALPMQRALTEVNARLATAEDAAAWEAVKVE